MSSIVVSGVCWLHIPFQGKKFTYVTLTKLACRSSGNNVTVGSETMEYVAWSCSFKFHQVERNKARRDDKTGRYVGKQTGRKINRQRERQTIRQTDHSITNVTVVQPRLY